MNIVDCCKRRCSEMVPGCLVDRGITSTYNIFTGITGIFKAEQSFHWPNQMFRYSEGKVSKTAKQVAVETKLA